MPNDEEMLGWRDRTRQLGPFALVVVVTFALSLIPPHVPGTRDLLVAAGGCFVLVGLLTVVVPWQRIPFGSALVVVVIFCCGVGLLRESGGGSAGGSGYGPLLLLPIIWQALYGRAVELWATIGAVAATLVVPILVEGGAEYPVSQWRLVLLFTLVGTATGLLVQQLVTSTSELNQELERLATCDQLTGLPNRRAWDQALAATLDGAGHGRSAFSDATGRRPPARAVALLDLDHFKAFNDAHGHLRADRALQVIAERWARRLGDRGLLARWGGEELAVLLADVDASDPAAVLRELADEMPEGLTFSAGLVVLDPPAPAQITSGHAMQAADDLLYQAKRSGRACVASATMATASTTPGGADERATEGTIRPLFGAVPEPAPCEPDEPAGPVPAPAPRPAAQDTRRPATHHTVDWLPSASRI